MALKPEDIKQLSYNSDLGKVRFQYNADDTVLYWGFAKPGTATNVTGWQIFKFTHDGNKNITAIDVADGTSEPDKIWDNRAALSYS